jgi:hypothetical protein
VGTIKEFLSDNSSSNLNVIITAIISSILTTFIIMISGKVLNKFKILSNKAKQYIKHKVNEFKSKINARQQFKRLYKEYQKDKSSYTLEKEFQSMFTLKYLTKKQKRKYEIIREENKDTVGKQIKEINDRMKETVNYNQEYFKNVYQKEL